MLKQPVLRDPAYIRAIRDMRCIVTGQAATDSDAVDPAHIGTAGKGVKSPDDEVLPLLHSIHLRCHQHGEMTTLRRELPDYVLRAALRAYARELYREWKYETGKMR